MVMLKVRIADLKAHLSRYLKTVRRGETITVLDRDTPVARLVPVEVNSSGLVVHRPRSPQRLSDLALPPRPARLVTDAVALLLEDRQSSR
jgi:prevent-host-death family protein